MLTYLWSPTRTTWPYMDKPHGPLGPIVLPCELVGQYKQSYSAAYQSWSWWVAHEDQWQQPSCIWYIDVFTETVKFEFMNRLPPSLPKHIGNIHKWNRVYWEEIFHIEIDRFGPTCVVMIDSILFSKCFTIFSNRVCCQFVEAEWHAQVVKIPVQRQSMYSWRSFILWNSINQ